MSQLVMHKFLITSITSVRIDQYIDLSIHHLPIGRPIGLHVVRSAQTVHRNP
jgi:hypothetical protein